MEEKRKKLIKIIQSIATPFNENVEKLWGLNNANVNDPSNRIENTVIHNEKSLENGDFREIHMDDKIIGNGDIGIGRMEIENSRDEQNIQLSPDKDIIMN